MAPEALDLQSYFPVASEGQWEEEARRVLKGKALEKLTHTTWEGIEVAPVFEERELPEYLQSAPDQAPFVRGQSSHQRRRNSWEIRAWATASALDAETLDRDRSAGAHSFWLTGIPAAQLPRIPSLLDTSQVPVFLDLSDLKAGIDFVRQQPSSELLGGLLWDPFAHPRPQWSTLAASLTTTPEDYPRLLFSGLPYHDAGAHGAQELAATLASFVGALRQLDALGVSVAEAIPRSCVRLGVGRQMFAEIAKFRAMRLLLSKVQRGLGIGTAQAIPLHACTSRTTATRRDPWVNFLRNTAECFSAAIGGADAITLMPFDYLHGVPSPLARRMALTTQLILAQESHLHRVIDPAGGSFYVEYLTDALARKAWELFQQIEARGGIGAVLDSGWLSFQIQEVVAAKQEAISRRKEPVLGVSEYAKADEARLEREPQETPEGGAPDAGTPDGFRWSAQWEALRDVSESQHPPPAVFFAKIGPLPAHKARAEFASRLFEAGGFRCIDSGGFDDPDAAAEAFAQSGARGLVICGTDEAYDAWVSPFLQALDGSAAFAVLAGRPKQEELWRSQGLTHAIFLGCRALDILQKLQSLAGVRS